MSYILDYEFITTSYSVTKVPTPTANVLLKITILLTNRPRGRAAKPLRAAGEENILCAAHALVRARTRQSPPEISGHPGSAGRDVCWRLAQDPRGISPHRTSSGASREQFLLFAICTGSTAVGGWARGLRKHHVGDWQRQPHENRGRHCVSALPGSVLQRRDAVPGLPEVWRRIQSHGAGRLRADRTAGTVP